MDYYCEVWDKITNSSCKYKRFKSNIHKEFDICKHMDLTIENPNIDNVDEVFYAYNIQYKKQ